MAATIGATCWVYLTKSASLIDWPLIAIRSLKRVINGEVKVPTVRPLAASIAALIATTEPLPLVPVTCK